MDRTVAHLNIEHYKRLLTTEADPRKRATLQKLLAEEEAKLASIQQPKTPSPGIRSNGGHD